MEDILELATKLGKRIAEDARAKRMAEARAAFETDATARQLLDDYEGQQQKLGELQMANKPIEPADKRRLADLHHKVITNAALKDLLKAQADYLELMTLVSSRIEQESLRDGNDRAKS
jgi:cell fate (sporulation/competence/biofilm development) regulator YlbF (YheA/YmcA/DUF963 family)